jgi:hypothetical protein
MDIYGTRSQYPPISFSGNFRGQRNGSGCALSTFLFELYKASSWELSINEHLFRILESWCTRQRSPRTPLMIHACHAFEAGAGERPCRPDDRAYSPFRHGVLCHRLGMASRGPIIIDWFGGMRGALVVKSASIGYTRAPVATGVRYRSYVI